MDLTDVSFNCCDKISIQPTKSTDLQAPPIRSRVRRIHFVPDEAFFNLVSWQFERALIKPPAIRHEEIHESI